MLTRQFRLEAPAAAQLGRDVARALTTAHAASIIHRDLKPANIFLHQEPGSDGLVVKVLDFGVSKNLAAQEAMTTAVGGIIGSPAYMSPEQIRASRDIDHRTDIWSLGVVLFEMLTGKRPFQEEPQEVIAKVLRGEVPRASKLVRNLDPSLDELVSRCLQPDRDKRIGSAAELAKLLSGFASSDVSRTKADGSELDSATPSVDASPNRISSPSSPDVDRPRSGGYVVAAVPREQPTPDVLGDTTLPLRPQGAVQRSSQPPAPAVTPEGRGHGGGTEASAPLQAQPAVTERLDPSHFQPNRSSSAPGIAAGSTATSARVAPPLMNVGTESGSDGGAAPRRTSTPPEVARGGTVKIPADQLLRHSPVRPAKEAGDATSTAPFLRATASSSPPGTGLGEEEPESDGFLGRWAKLPARARMAGVAAVVVFALLSIGISIMLLTPKQSPVLNAVGMSASVFPSFGPSAFEATGAPGVAPPGSSVLAAPSQSAAPSSEASAGPVETVIKMLKATGWC
jgi:serine/threonine-protein kinase